MPNVKAKVKTRTRRLQSSVKTVRRIMIVVSNESMATESHDVLFIIQMVKNMYRFTRD